MDIGEIKARLTGDVTPLKVALSDAKSAIGTFASEAEKSGKQASQSLNSLAGEFSSMKQRISALGAEVNGVSRSWQEMAGNIAPAMIKIGGAMSGFAAAAAGFGIAAAKNFGKYAEQIGILADQTGLSQDAVQRFNFALNRVNLSVEDLVPGFKKISQAYQQAIQGNEKAIEKFSAFGITIDDLKQKTPEQIFLQIADAASKMQDPWARNAALTELFGRSALRLVPALKDGAQGFQSAGEAAARLGTIFSNEALKSAQALDDQFDDLNMSFSTFSRVLGETFATVMKDIVPVLTEALGAFNSWWRSLDEGTRTLSVKFIAAFGAGGLIITAVGGFMTLLAAITAPMLATGAIVVGIVAGVILLVAKWQWLKQQGQEIWDAQVKVWQDAKTNITNAISGLVAGVVKTWTALKDAVVGTAKAIYDGIVLWLVTKAEAVAAKLQSVAQSFARPFEWLADYLVGRSIIPDMVDDVELEMQRMAHSMEREADRGAHGVADKIAGQIESLDLRLGAAQRVTVATMRDILSGQAMTWRMAQEEMLSVTINTWGQITNTISNALATQLISGNDWKQTMLGLATSVLSAFINLAFQATAQWILSLATQAAQADAMAAQQVTSHTAMEAAKTSATVAGEAARAGMVLATNKAVAASSVSSIIAIGAVGNAAFAVMEAVLVGLTGFLLAIAASVAWVPIAGQVLAGALIAGAGILAFSGQAAIVTGLAGLNVALGAAITAAASSAFAFADGGIVTGPTLGLLGEAGSAEAAIPLNDTGAAFMRKVMGMESGRIGPITINVHLGGRLVAREVFAQLPRHVYTMGVA